jgi:hypothetical protein
MVKAVIRLDVPDWQIGQEVSVYFRDTMMKHGICEREPEAVEPDIMDFARYTNGRKQRRKAWCGACGLRIRIGSTKQDRSNFCERCGRRVKWE